MDGSDWEEEIWPQSLKKLRCLQFAKDESHIQRRPIKMRFFHQNENCRISAILGLRRKLF